VLPDGDIVRRFQETGDNACFAELFTRHRQKVFFACRGFFPDVAAAAKNVCIDQWRKRRPETGIEEIESTGRSAVGRSDANYDLRLAVQRVWQEVKCPSPEQRRCLEMKIGLLLMSDWHEDNFLENLMPPLRRKLGAELDPCPDAETLSAVIEERGGLPGHEAEWADTQKRLDNWIAGFLASEAARRTGRTAPTRTRPRPSHGRSGDYRGLPAWPPPNPAPVEMPVLKAAKPAKLARKHISTLPVPVEDQPSPKSAEPGATEQEANVAEPPPQPPTPAAPSGSSSASRALGRVPGTSRAHLPFQSLLPTPTQPAPTLPRIEAGAAVWIRLSSVSRQAGGSFTFRGSLLLPVANVTLLDQGTLVYGAGAVEPERYSSTPAKYWSCFLSRLPFMSERLTE